MHSASNENQDLERNMLGLSRNRGMKISGAAFVFVMMGAVSASSQSTCANFKNDAGRLACFDAEAETKAAPDVATAEAGLQAALDASDSTHSFHCLATNGEPSFYIFRSLTGDAYEQMKMTPPATNARLVGTVYTADLLSGTISITDGKFALLTDDGLVTGSCQNYDNEMKAFLGAIQAEDPKAIEALANAALRNAAMKQIAGLQSTVEALQNTVEALQKQISEHASDQRTERRKFRSLVRENDRLKLRMCELNPKSTFSVCKPAP